MLFHHSPSFLIGALLATNVVAGPVAVRSPDVAPATVERRDGLNLGSFSLATTHEKDVLFNLGMGSTDGSVSESLRLEVECVDCRTWGTAVITTGGVQKDDSLLQDIEAFFENPIDAIVSAFDLDVKISFENVGGHFDFDIYASDTVSYSFPIFASSSPSGVAVSEEVTFGFVLFVDLVFSLTAEINLEAGFEFAFPDGAYVTVDPLGGNIVDHGFTGGDVHNLPIVCTSGSATFKAALRVRVQAGTTVELFGTGFDFELGVYADLIEYEATLASTAECDLAVTESLDVNIGAFAHAILEIDYSTVGASPALVTTVLDVPLPSLCITRAAESSLPAFPTAAPSAIPITTAAAAGSLPTASPSVPVFTIASSTASSPSSGGIFMPIPTFSDFSTASPSNSTSASLTTSTIYTTTLLTVTHCASTILNCPASLASEIVVTSTSVLYTTICPVGQSQPTYKPTLPTASTSTAAAIVHSTIIISPLPLTPCATPIISTVYTPTFVQPTYTMPAASVLSSLSAATVATVAPYPTAKSNGTVPTYKTAIVTSSITVAPVSSSTAGLGPAKVISAPVAYGTGVPTPQRTTTASTSNPNVVPYTGSAAKPGLKASFAIVIAGVGLLIMI